MSGDSHGYNPAHVRSDPRPSVLGLAPTSRVHGAVRLPASKSIAQRTLVCAALASGVTRISALGGGEDSAAALALIEQAGARVERLAPKAVAIHGRPPGPHRGWTATRALDAGESGTLARLATAALGFCATSSRALELHVRGTLAKRKSPALFDALRTSGVRFEALDGATPGGWPVRMHPIGPPSSVTIVDPSSSQEVSALLVALAAYPDATRLEVSGAIPSRPYLDMTIASLATFGARIERHASAHGEAFDVRGPLTAPITPIAIEPDASAAAVALAAACLSGGTVRIAGLSKSSLQGDVRIVEHLRAFGCDARFEDDALVGEGRVTRAADVDLEREPDLAPVVAMLAARAALEGFGASRLQGLHTLPGKESSRIDVLATGVRAVGLAATATQDALTIAPGAVVRAPNAALDPHGDHRMAFAFALLGLCVEGVRVRDPQCVAKSWPEFWTDLERAGGVLVRDT